MLTRLGGFIAHHIIPVTQGSSITLLCPFPYPKIESEEYEEALSLAQTYGLDTDLVYQRQWRKSAVNIASIQNYLVGFKILVRW